MMARRVHKHFCASVPHTPGTVQTGEENAVAEFQSFAADVEVLGDVIEAFVAGFPPELSKIGSNLLTAKGIDRFRRGEYYPLQSFLDAMKEIKDKFSSEMLFRIGEKIAANAVLPPGIDSLATSLPSINTAY